MLGFVVCHDRGMLGVFSSRSLSEGIGSSVLRGSAIGHRARYWGKLVRILHVSVMQQTGSA